MTEGFSMKKRITVLAAAVLMLFNLPACAFENKGFSETSELSLSENYKSVEGRKVKMTAQNAEVVIVLNGSKAAADFAGMLPLELTLIERNGFAKGMTLPRRLSTDEETTREYEIGDFGYWAAGPDLAIFYNNLYEKTIVPIIPMGRAEAGAESIRDTYGAVMLELLPEGENE